MKSDVQIKRIASGVLTVVCAAVFIQLNTFAQPAARKPPPADDAPFISEDGRFSIVMPKAFVPFKQNSFRSVSSWGDPMTVVQHFSYPDNTPASRLSDPPYYAMTTYFDYSASVAGIGFDSELLEIVHKATLRKFPEFIISQTERAYWKPESGVRTPAPRLDEAVIRKGSDRAVITSFARTETGDQLVRADSYLAGRRIYWVIAVYSPTSGFDKISANSFCDSFRINPA